MALEFEPAGRNKETAVANFTGQPTFRGRRPMPAGDVTDEDGFVAVKPVPHESIRVRPAAETAAEGRAAGVDEIIAWRDAALEAGHEKH